MTASAPRPRRSCRPKARRLRGLAARWLTETGTTAEEVRFDVLSVLLPDAGPAQVDHLKGAF